MLKYLAYGSNLHPERLRRRVPSSRVLGTVALDGWRLAFHKRGGDGSGKCNIVPTGAAGDRVHGVVYAMAADERPALDRVEGVGFGYEHHHFELAPFGEVFAYVADHPHLDDTLRPYTWYRDFVVHGARYHGLPADYVRRLADQHARQDPDPSRTRENRAILEALAGTAE